MNLLAGVGVLVTRPEHQADTLCRLLERRGATAYRLPALRIVPAADLGALAGRLAPLERFELIVFTSANAVRFGAALLDSMPAATLAAIGPATARALEECGHRVVATPLAGFDSAGLLEHPLLEHPRGRRILIVKGLHGRELLEDSLARRGAEVTVAEVYARRAPRPRPGC